MQSRHGSWAFAGLAGTLLAGTGGVGAGLAFGAGMALAVSLRALARLLRWEGRRLSAEARDVAVLACAAVACLAGRACSGDRVLAGLLVVPCVVLVFVRALRRFGAQAA